MPSECIPRPALVPLKRDRVSERIKLSRNPYHLDDSPLAAGRFNLFLTVFIHGIFWANSIFITNFYMFSADNVFTLHGFRWILNDVAFTMNGISRLTFDSSLTRLMESTHYR